MRSAAERDVDRLYADALDALVRMQTRGGDGGARAAALRSRALMREMELMPEWFFEPPSRSEAPDAAERAMLDRSVRGSGAVAPLAQPAMFVHRDYHSRNLLVSDDGQSGHSRFPGCGARRRRPTMLVSLLKDCYIAWPRERVIGWAARVSRAAARAPGLPSDADERKFIRWFDLMGLQRHIKVLGIFARLFYRDGKPGYLEDLPRVLAYARDGGGALPRDRRVRATTSSRASSPPFDARAGAHRPRGTERDGGSRERPRTAMILAAGRGERMRPLTDRVPKPLLEVRGKPLIEYHLERLARAGIEQIVVNLAWLGAMIRERPRRRLALWGARSPTARRRRARSRPRGGIFRALPLLGPGAFWW